MEKLIYKNITEKIIGSFYSVYNTLGSGFLESVYEKALIIEFNERGLKTETQKPLVVKYHDKVVGEFRPDIIVEDKIIIEIKAISKLSKIHESQILNYLKATDLRLGFLVNFGEKLEYQRRIL